ncbi:MAG: Mur ligase family protein, partial [Bacteroidota bacterium]|nr:Mur ligase family protein [Bacteroidota bacterium]
MLEEIYQAFLSCNQNVTTDTRKISEGCIFFALKGPNFNGNKFASEAIKKGAAYVVIDEENIEIEDKSFLVQDVLTTLQKLSNYHRRQFEIPVIGITGTNGKTTTKELIGEVLKAKYNILITEGNLNNHIGVPLTLLRLNKDHEMAVIEMGASKRGDIKELVEIADPYYGIITNIGKAHLEGFGSTETIKKTKMEMYDYILDKDGKIIY